MHSDSNPMNAYLDGERHIFVDNVRFWSMIGIVAIHSASVFIVIENAHPLLIAALVPPARFGAIQGSCARSRECSAGERS